MKKVYVLTAFDMQTKYYTEKLMFSNKKSALKQMAYLREYLIYNHDLSVGNIEHIGQSTDDIFTIFLDDSYNVTLTTHPLRTTASKYI